MNKQFDPGRGPKSQIVEGFNYKWKKKIIEF